MSRPVPLPRRRWWSLLLLLVPMTVLADAPQPVPEGPYFVVENAEPGVDGLPLKATEVKARVLGVIADVSVTQHYRNEGSRALEARYVFPGSTRAAVHGMTVRIGQRVIEARIEEKGKAREDYEAAKVAGQTAALLEQQRSNVFEMNVANILPGDVVDVELRYTELLVPAMGSIPSFSPPCSARATPAGRGRRRTLDGHRAPAGRRAGNRRVQPGCGPAGPGGHCRAGLAQPPYPAPGAGRPARAGEPGPGRRRGGQP